MWFDTHAHLDDPQLAPGLGQVLERAHEASVVGILAVGTTLASSLSCLQLARTHDGIGAAVGIHPNYAHQATPEDFNQLQSLASDPRVWAIGETGLDRYWDDCPFDIQLEAFRRQIDLSASVSKPFIVHMRDCEAEMLAELQRAVSRHGTLKGIMHSFAGSYETAQVALNAGLHISFSGMLTYPKNQALRELAAQIPRERLLIETDCPYLSPHPHRSRRPNEPELVAITGRCLAEALDLTSAELGLITTNNALQLFGQPQLHEKG